MVVCGGSVTGGVELSFGGTVLCGGHVVGQFGGVKQGPHGFCVVEGAGVVTIVTGLLVAFVTGGLEVTGRIGL